MKQVLILGNGKSRSKVHNFILSWQHEIWVCNEAYKEAVYYKNITRVGTVHNDLVSKMNHFAKKHKIGFDVWVKNTKNLPPNTKAKAFTKPRGWSTGNEMIQQALIEKYDKILLAGFTFGGADIYQAHLLVGTNFIRQFNRIKEEYNTQNVYFLNELIEEIPIDGVNVSSDPLDNKKAIQEKIAIDYSNYRCIIIGNGTSVRKQKLGSEIDKFDIVIRINDYRIKGFEDYVGEKTSFFFSGIGNQTKVKRNIDKINQNFAVFPINIHKYETAFLKQKIASRFGFEACTKFKIIPEDTIKKLIKICNIDYPSTGLMTILYCRHILKMLNITLYGFDCFSDGLHYYDSMDVKTRISDGHSFTKENEFIQNMINRGDLYEMCISDNA